MLSAAPTGRGVTDYRPPAEAASVRSAPRVTPATRNGGSGPQGSPGRPGRRRSPVRRVVLIAQVVPLLALALLVLLRPTRAMSAAPGGQPPVDTAPVRRILHPDLHPVAISDDLRASQLVGKDPEPAGSTAYSVDLGGTLGTRYYVLHVPAHLPSGPRPMVLVLPGLRNSADTVQQESGFDAVGDTTGAIVVYPQGVKESWDAGTCCGTSQAQGVDDVDALRGIVDSVETQEWIDRRKVVIAGFSNGGMMAYRMACEQARGIAGLIVVSGSLEVDGCAPAAPVALVVSHGLADNTVPVGGEPVANHTVGVPTRSLMDSIAPFVAADRCAPMVRVKRLPPYRVDYYRDCAAGTQITEITVDTLNHDWPGPTLGGDTFSSKAYALLADRRSQTEFR